MQSINRGQKGGTDRVNRDPMVSVIIVNFNGGWLLTQAVCSVLKATIPLEILIVDNGSRDNSLACLRSVVGRDARVQFIENGRNLGFACANNIALKQVRGEYALLLNPDCIVHPDTLSSLYKIVGRFPEVGMVGCLIRNPDGTEQVGCRRSVPTPWRTFVRVLHLNKIFPHHPRFRSFILTQQLLPQQPFELEAISGAFMMVRREALEQVGLLDEHYFLHCEDLDWCMRFRQAGWKILFVPEVEVVHYKGICSQNRPIQVLWHKHKGMARFYRKFFRHQYPLPLMILVMASVWGRFSLLALLALVQILKEVNSNKRGRLALRGGIYKSLVLGRKKKNTFQKLDKSSPTLCQEATKRAGEG
jgi:GT2 family glycosyltransferase